MAPTKLVRVQCFGKEQNSSRTGITTLLKVCEAIQNNVFGTVLLRMGLLWSAGDYLSNLDCAALRAMTGHEGESAGMLLGTIFETLWRNPQNCFFRPPVSLLRFPFFPILQPTFDFAAH